MRLAGLNHKMGWRGTTNAVLSFGEQGDCRAELVGEEHRGLEYMFRMMNAARIGVGMNAVALGYAAYMEAVAYARERPQGRPVASRDPATPPVAILRHADVRRMLLAQKCWVEGGLALVLYCARLADEARCAPGDGERARLHGLLELLTPIAKSWPSEYCLEANKLAIQVHGGYGYTRDYPVERLYRDNRLNHIHEGTHGIHGLDLLGRKVPMQEGAALKELFARMNATIEASRNSAALAEFGAALAAAIADIGETTKKLMQALRGNPELALANATLYLDSLGHVVVAWRWLVQALAAEGALPTAPESDRDFYAGKIVRLPLLFPLRTAAHRADATPAAHARRHRPHHSRRRVLEAGDSHLCALEKGTVPSCLHLVYDASGLYGKPRSRATASCVIEPSCTFSPAAKPGSLANAFCQPLSASERT